MNNFRGRGIGKKIQKELIDESCRRGYSFDYSVLTIQEIHLVLNYMTR